MRIAQMIFCILAVVCVLAAAFVGAFLQNLIAVLCLLLGAAACALCMALCKRRGDSKEEREARRHRRDFMDPDPSEENKE